MTSGFKAYKCALLLGWLVVMLCGAGCASAQTYETKDSTWWEPGSGQVFPQKYNYTNANGVSRILLAGVSKETANHPFFTPLSSNGRACITCHQPSDGMSLSVTTIRERWFATDGKDPLFIAYDGSNCPTLPQRQRSSHSLLLDRGLFRIQLPWPPQAHNGKKVEPDFSIHVVRDPSGCNTGEVYGLSGSTQSISVYRRPRPVANLKYLTSVGFAYDPKQGMPLPRDAKTGRILSGNIMSDNRVGTLREQMQDAAHTHLEMTEALTENEQQLIEDFILRVYAAQSSSNVGGVLSDGALGGPELLRDSKPGQLGSIGRAVWSEFAAWESLDSSNSRHLTKEQINFRVSVARGARIFREKMFLITDSAGINSPIGFGNPVLNSCVFCHNMSQMGNDVAPGQVDLGTTTAPFSDPAPHLPLFKISCENEPHPHYGNVIYTQDPGYALITGRCADVGKITLQSMRSLSARAPYFSNGSAKNLRAVVDFYERRYNIGYTEQEKQDLVNLMSVL
ncbi:MAG: hypothetical protein JKY66_02675 [Spongiibacteraceae bacterium]|nr:hypothetical protein [Spongiibacteraceae bacterium]